jgi:cell wall-associated NlpC family hydrolase
LKFACACVRRVFLNQHNKQFDFDQSNLQVRTNMLNNARPFKKFQRTAICLAAISFLLLSSLIQSALFGFGLEVASAESGLKAGSQARVSNTDGDGVRLRTAPDAKASTILTLSENWQVTIKGGPYNDSQGNSFYKVEWSNRTGYAMTQYLSYSGKSSAGTSSKSLPVGGQVRVSGTSGDGVRMRQQANASASTLSILSENYLLTVLGGPFNDNQGNSFFKVEWAGYTGYVSGTYLTTAPKTAVAGTGGSMRVTNTDGDPIRFRTGPSRSYDSNGYAYEGQVLKLLAGPFKDSAGNQWYKLDRNGEVGYIDGSYVRRTDQATTTVSTNNPPRTTTSNAPVAKPQPIPAPASNGPLGQRIADYAKQFVGWRYVWGGHSPAAGGFDCSGLVYWVLNQNGVSVGSSVGADLAVGSPVPADKLQPGDVLIWANTYTSGPSHSGIYLGGGRFVHAETYSTGVTINNLSDAYYASRFYAARRPGV